MSMHRCIVLPLIAALRDRITTSSACPRPPVGVAIESYNRVATLMSSGVRATTSRRPARRHWSGDGRRRRTAAGAATTMHSSNLFRDQVGTLTGWFRSWNECEQTVALYSLLLKVAPAQAKFLLQVLEHSVADCAEVQQLECQANNSGESTRCEAPAPRSR